LTPSSFARATISILFLDETAWEILGLVSLGLIFNLFYILCSEGFVVHEEKVDISGVVD